MPKFIKALAVILLILMVIGSFALGNLYPKIVQPISKYGYPKTEYNFSLAITGVLISTIVFAMLYAIGYAIERVNTLTLCMLGICKEKGINIVEKKEKPPVVEVDEYKNRTYW